MKGAEVNRPDEAPAGSAQRSTWLESWMYMAILGVLGFVAQVVLSLRASDADEA
jgi:hypothetical protein